MSTHLSVIGSHNDNCDVLIKNLRKFSSCCYNDDIDYAYKLYIKKPIKIKEHFTKFYDIKLSENEGFILHFNDFGLVIKGIYYFEGKEIFLNYDDAKIVKDVYSLDYSLS